LEVAAIWTLTINGDPANVYQLMTAKEHSGATLWASVSARLFVQLLIVFITNGSMLKEKEDAFQLLKNKIAEDKDIVIGRVDAQERVTVHSILICR